MLSLNGVAVAADPVCPAPANTPLLSTSTPRIDSSKARIDVSSDNATLGVNGDAALQGNVRVRQGEREIRAEDVQYNGKSEAFKVTGKVEYFDPALHVTGNDGNYSPTGGADFNTAEFEMRQRPGRGVAKSMNLTPGGILKLEGVRFTTCPESDEAWNIRADALTLDTTANLGTGRGARVDFKGVPIMYLPWMSFPLGSERKSGFLFPSIGHTSRSGFQTAVPYYWNIAPNADATIEPILYSRRGIDFSGDLRHMRERQRSEFTYHFLPSDDIAQRDRSYVRLDHVTELPGAFRFRVDAANASDMQYFEDFAQGPEGTSVSFVERLATISYRDENWRFSAEAQHYQTIIRDLLDSDRPYARVPRIVGSGDFGFGPGNAFRYGFDSEVVNFERSTGVTGWRLDASPTIGLDIEGAGYFMRPGLAWRYTKYALEDTAPGQADDPDRSLPIASLDAGLLFERLSGSRGKRTMTLEPRALYLHVPYRNQDDLPLFDSGLPDLNLVQLFRTNRYVGADRVSDAEQVSIGVTSRLLETATGKQFVTATLGQTYYLESPRVFIPGEILRDRDTSDVIAQLTVTAYKDWNIDLGLQYDPDMSRTQRQQVNVQYRPANDKVVNVGYRSQRDRLEQTDVSAAWPITQRWSAFSRFVYSLRDEKALERFGGIEYRSCCWRVRVVGRRFVSSRTGEQDTGIYLQLELNGLASVGSAADSFLETSIRGYSLPKSTL